ncbi:hypothetical protein Syun_007374 [Stephania yunnanensis]|uniref:DRBM domain-containing protein n=1 Tax=Stephania yunnanensis TaxID=152371 RepID=A0AAP0PYM8_9MAGN
MLNTGNSRFLDKACIKVHDGGHKKESPWRLCGENQVKQVFEGPNYCTTLRQAEHAAAEVALNSLSTKGPSRSIAARVLDETGVHKNQLQETAHRAGLNLPVYTTVRSSPGHLPVFTSTVELEDLKFNGAPTKTKKQVEKNAAMAAWAALKQSNHTSF